MKKCIAVILSLAAAASANAQTFPAKPIRWIVPYAAGGGSDFLARTVAQTLSTQVAQPVLVDNKPGGNTALAAAETARAPADGYTILSADNGTLVFNPALYKSLSYSPTKDLAPVTLMGKFPMILVVGANSGFASAPGLHRPGQGQARRHQLRLGRRGQPAPPGDGAAQGRVEACSWSTCRTAARRPRWPTWSADSVPAMMVDTGRGRRLHQGRQGARRWPWPTPRACRSCPMCPPSPSSASRTSRRPPWSAWWCLRHAAGGGEHAQQARWSPPSTSPRCASA